MRTDPSSCFAGLLLVWGCGGSGAAAAPDRPPQDPTGAETTAAPVTSEGGASESGSSSGSSDSTGPVVGGCSSSAGCDGAFCRAPTMYGPTPLPGDFVCGACVELDDPALWCADAASCCDADAVCELGLCHSDSSGSTSTSGSTGA